MNHTRLSTAGLASCGPEPAGTGNASIVNVGSPGGGLVAAIASDDAVADAAHNAVDDAVAVGAVEAADVVARSASRRSRRRLPPDRSAHHSESRPTVHPPEQRTSATATIVSGPLWHGRSARRTHGPLGLARRVLLGRPARAGGLLHAGCFGPPPSSGRSGLARREHDERTRRRDHRRLLLRWPPHPHERPRHRSDDALAAWPLHRRQANPVSDLDHELAPLFSIDNDVCTRHGGPARATMAA